MTDSLYGESSEVISALHRLSVRYVVAIRSNNSVRMFPGQRLRRTHGRSFARLFTAGSSEQRSIRELVFGACHMVLSFAITTDPVHLPKEMPKASTWDLI